MIVMIRMNNALCGDCWWMVGSVRKRDCVERESYWGSWRKHMRLEFRTTASASSRPGRIAR